MLDRPVGYCQGLSFVAGLLLMHLEEEDAFEALRHLMYAHNVRQQYKADMQELQVRDRSFITSLGGGGGWGGSLALEGG